MEKLPIELAKTMDDVEKRIRDIPQEIIEDFFEKMQAEKEEMLESLTKTYTPQEEYQRFLDNKRKGKEKFKSEGHNYKAGPEHELIQRLSKDFT